MIDILTIDISPIQPRGEAVVEAFVNGLKVTGVTQRARH